MPRPLIAGNWKLNMLRSGATELATALRKGLEGESKADVVVCPPFIAIPAVVEALRGSAIGVGGQDLYWQDSGAFTGEVSAPMLADAGCRWVIVGHSERRQYFGETDETVAKKLRAAQKAGLTPIVCVGERLEEREKGVTKDVVGRQVDGALGGLSKDELKKLAVAYEPVWAIGTGKVATPEQAQEVHAFIRWRLAGLSDEATAREVRLLYGGSVTPENVRGLMEKPDVNGALVGGASLKAESFLKIVRG
ncbi:MAG: triose-phosphate isomerase [Planctomycetia bacterium]|nr:triose-phosphate isomerase [Planctomycetia bacterium]